MKLVKWNNRLYDFSEDLNHIYLLDIEESLKHKTRVVCSFPKSEQSTVKCFKELEFIVEATLGKIVLDFFKNQGV